MAGWLTVGEVLAVPSASELEGAAACLLDCADDVRVARIERRAASGMWRQHTPGEVAGFLLAASRMRESGEGVFRLDTSTLDPGAVVSGLEDWMTHAGADRPGNL